MRNLAKFFLKRHFFFLFLFLEAISFTLIVESNKFHKARFLNYTSAFTGAVYTRIDDVTDYLALKDINRELADENARLKTMEKNSFIKLNNRDIAVDDTLYRQRYKYLSAKVIKSTTSFANNYIILNRGSEQGVEPEMAVMSKEGVIGLVRDVSGHYCSVLPLLHSRTRVSAMLENSKYQGIIRWDGRDPGIVKLRDIPQHVQLKIGEEVVTRGASGMFPEG
ncbi:MAG: rod shape-determining protein MreC, partial [Flavobacteriales bacterium]